MLTIWSDRLLTQRWKDFLIKHDLTNPLKIRRRINKRRNGQKARNRFPKQFEIPCLAWKLSFQWTAYTGTICYTKPPMSFSNQKKKKKEMKLTAAQCDWDTLHQLVVSFIRLPLAWIQKQVSACCFCFCLELGLGQPFLASWSLVPKTFSVQLMFFFLPPFVNVLLPVCPRGKKAKIIRRRSQIRELTLLLPAS